MSEEEKMFLRKDKTTIPDADRALPGRDVAIQAPARHAALDATIDGPFPETSEQAIFALGCFWGAERIFWQLPGVISTSVGYVAGITPNPSYQEVCSGRTGHTEAVRVIYDPQRISFNTLLKVFWEGHDPTQGMRQGNDVGTQYRSGIYTYTEEQLTKAEQSKKQFQEQLSSAGYGDITAEIQPAGKYYFAEDYHQQYLHKNPSGYCGIGGTGVTCAVGPV
jgi:peptide-methionine (S)-S-oxide reductase